MKFFLPLFFFLCLPALAQDIPPVHDLPDNGWLGKLVLWMCIIGAIGGIGWIGKRRLDNEDNHRRDRYESMESALSELKDELKDFKRDVEGRLQGERNVAREALGKIHNRIDKGVEVTSDIAGQMKQLSEGMKMLLSKAIE